MTIPGYGAEASLSRTNQLQRGKIALEKWEKATILPQFRLDSVGGLDLVAYVRCLENGGDELICRFFARVPLSTIRGIKR
jgi:hypothetical protein